MIDLHNFEKFSKKSVSVKKEEEKFLSWCYSEIAVKTEKNLQFFFRSGHHQKIFFLDETDLIWDVK